MKKFIGLVILLLILVLILSCVVCTVGGVMLPPMKRALVNAEDGSGPENSGFGGMQSSESGGDESGFVVQYRSGVVGCKASASQLLSFLPWLILIAGLLFFLMFCGLILLVLRRIFLNPEKRKQREVCYDELRQLSQDIAGLDLRLNSLEEIIAS